MATLWARAARTGLGLLVALTLLGGPVAGGSGAGTTVTQGLLQLSVQVGLGGVLRPGLPFPVQLHAENRGGDLEAEWRVLTRRSRLDQPWSQVDELRLPVRLPAGGRFTWNLTLAAEDLVHPLVVELWPEATPGAEPLRLEIALRPLAAQEHVLALVSRRGLNLNIEELNLEEASPFSPGMQVVQLRGPEELPHRWDGWLAADWVVVDDVSLSSLAAPQLEALTLWVMSGGRLLILPRAAPPSLAGHARTLLPVSPLGRSLSLQETLTELGTLPEGSTLFLSLAAPGAEVLYSLAGVPLAARAPLGLGSTGWIGFDLADPLLGAPIRAALLEAGLGGALRVPPPDAGSGTALTWRSLRSVPVLPSSPFPLAALLAGHALLAYLLVRWAWGRPRLLLLGVGALAAMASLLILLSSNAAPGSAAAAVQVLEVSGGWGRGWGAWALGQSAPQVSRLGLGLAAWQAGPLDDGRPDARTLLTVEADLGSYRWQGTGHLPATVLWPLKLDLHLVDAGNGAWRVENRSEAHLERVLFYDGENLLPLPDLPPGQSATVHPQDPWLRLGRIGVRPGGLAELRRWIISRLDPSQLTAPRTPLVTRAVEEGWERLQRHPEPLPAVLAFVEPSPLPPGAPQAEPAGQVSLVLLRPSASEGGEHP